MAGRAHLATLERDGVVQQRGERRGSGKPAYVYELAPAAEQLFPKAYGPVLDQLLEVLSEHLSPERVETLLREAGRRIAARWNVPPRDLRMRLEVAVAVLHELGGMVELEAFEDHYCLRGYSCPLVAVVSPHRVPPHGVSRRSCPRALWRERKVAVLLYRRKSIIKEKSYARMGLLDELPATNRK